MLRPVNQANTLQEVPCSVFASPRGLAGNQQGKEGVFKNRALGKEIMLLENKTDLSVSETGELTFAERKSEMVDPISLIWCPWSERYRFLFNCCSKCSTEAI